MDATDRGCAICLRFTCVARGFGAGGRAGGGSRLLIEDLATDLDGRAFEVVKVADGWMMRTKNAYAPAIRTAADIEEQLLDLNQFDVAVLAAIAYHQPITRDGLRGIFGKEISRDLIGRLHARDLVGTGPRSPKRGAPYTFVTTEQFLVAFNLETLRDLPDKEQLEDAGFTADSDEADI